MTPTGRLVVLPGREAGRPAGRWTPRRRRTAALLGALVAALVLGWWALRGRLPPPGPPATAPPARTWRSPVRFGPEPAAGWRVERSGEGLVIARYGRGFAELVWLDAGGALRSGPLRVATPLPPAPNAGWASWVERSSRGLALMASDGRAVEAIHRLPPGAEGEGLVPAGHGWALAWREPDLHLRLGWFPLPAAREPAWLLELPRGTTLDMAGWGEAVLLSALELGDRPAWVLRAVGPGGRQLGALGRRGPPGRLLWPDAGAAGRSGRAGDAVLAEAGPDGRSRVQAVGLAGAAGVAGFTQRWQVDLPGRVEAAWPLDTGRRLAALVRAGGRSTVYALDGMPLRPRRRVARPLLDVAAGGRAVPWEAGVVVEGDGELVAFAADGRRLWQLPLPAGARTVVAWPDALLVASGTGLEYWAAGPSR